MTVIGNERGTATILRDLDTTLPSLQWVITAYAITFGGFLLVGGRAADISKWSKDDQIDAMERAYEWGDRIPIGLFWKREDLPSLDQLEPVDLSGQADIESEPFSVADLWQPEAPNATASQVQAPPTIGIGGSVAAGKSTIALSVLRLLALKGDRAAAELADAAAEQEAAKEALAKLGV